MAYTSYLLKLRSKTSVLLPVSSANPFLLALRVAVINPSQRRNATCSTLVRDLNSQQLPWNVLKQHKYLYGLTKSHQQRKNQRVTKGADTTPAVTFRKGKEPFFHNSPIPNMTTTPGRRRQHSYINTVKMLKTREHLSKGSSHAARGDVASSHFSHHRPHLPQFLSSHPRRYFTSFSTPQKGA